MQFHTKVALILVALGAVTIVGIRFILPLFEETKQRQTSDARATKGKLNIGMDNWIGYYPLCSNEMRKRIRHSGYNIQCDDDKANYADRMKRLEKGELQFAVATVDSYLLNAAKVNFPGTIIAVIDESKGGDAIVAWKDKIQSLDALKQLQNFKIAFTPQSPSEHLLKSIAVHFDIPSLRKKNSAWRIETNGSEDALAKFINKKSDLAVLWEPDVTRAMQNDGVVKLLGTEDTNKLIVDILVVNRDFSQKNPDAVKTLLQHYFRTLKFYNDSPDNLISDAAKETNLSEKTIKTLLNGVAWTNLTENSQSWFGVNALGIVGEEGLVEAIESTAQILIDSGDFSNNPIPDQDPYRLTNSQFIGELFTKGMSSNQFGQTHVNQDVSNTVPSLERKFLPFSNDQWSKLREIGTLKIRPVVFQSGIDELTHEGKEELDMAVEHLKRYPNFRIVIKGHTGIKGDKNANKKLSQERADSVARYISVTYGVDLNRMHPKGLGGSKPLEQLPGESTRAYNYRLPRVELSLVGENI